MSARPLRFLAAAAALLLLALPATAQTATGTLKIDGLAASATSNQTQASLPFNVAFNVSMGSCVGGGTVQVALTPHSMDKNVTVEVNPPSMSFHIGQADTLSAPFGGAGGATLLVKPGLVRSNTTVTAMVDAQATVSCAVPGAGMAPQLTKAEGTSTVKFVPVSEEVANGPTEALPGLELPALLAAICVAVFLARRQK